MWIGDGFCDDMANRIECNYDGGDCCGSNANYQFCFECLCLPINGSTIPPVTSTGKHFDLYILDMYIRPTLAADPIGFLCHTFYVIISMSYFLCYTFYVILFISHFLCHTLHIRFLH